MASKSTDMQAIFSELSESNKDIIILLAKGMRIAEHTTKKPRKPPQKVS